MEAAVAHLLDFSKPFDHGLLDSLSALAMDGKHDNATRAKADKVLVLLQEHPDMWKRADTIIENSTSIYSKIFACNVLVEAISVRWRVIPPEQREGIKTYILGKIVYYSSTSALAKENHLLLSKLNITLVSILKQDWPQNWPTFIHELVMSAQTSESLCENSMSILRLLSEEIFEFSKDALTSAKARQLKESLTEEFSKVFQLCEAVLSSTTSVSLIKSTLSTLQRFLTWIPLGYIFETSLIPVLITNFLPTSTYRNETIMCLVEMTSLPLEDINQQYYPMLHTFLSTFISTLQSIIPRDYDLALSYGDNTLEEKEFIRGVALFLGPFLQSYFTAFEVSGAVVPALQDTIHAALEYLIVISRIEDEDLFKICLDYWAFFAKDLYDRSMKMKLIGFGLGLQRVNPMAFIEDIVHALRIITIDHMAKPEEVIVVVDENGDIIREKTKDSEVQVQYKTMRDTIVYLTHLNCDDTTCIMLDKLSIQVSFNFTYNGLNTLCWAIGSISGAMPEHEEKTFLISVVRDLLKLCEDTKGKNNKSVVASNIMYIVGQYPRFLRAHWKFLKTVVNKLFEFMHESHPGVQDMSCDTFLKIAQKCKRKFITSQGENEVPYIITLINDLSRHTFDLQPHQVQSFYESVATMLSDKDAQCPVPREEIIVRLMDIQNTAWLSHVSLGRENPAALLPESVSREFLRILKLNNRVCIAAGSIYIHQLATFFNDALAVYHLYSEAIVEGLRTEGVFGIRKSNYKALRAVKVEFLELMSSFFDVCYDLPGGAAACIPLFLNNLLSKALSDYCNSPPEVREAAVLTMLASAVNAFKNHLNNDMPTIMAAIFEPTLALITSNMTDHYDHRVGFFKFLRSANEHCFEGLFSIPPNQQKLIIDSIIWAFKHTERNIAETGLETLVDLLKKVNSDSKIAGPFYREYMLMLLKEILAVLTDRQHKSGFRLHSQILMMLCHSTLTPGLILEPLCQPGEPYDSNAHYIKSCIQIQLTADFSNVSPSSIAYFVDGFFDVKKDAEVFKEHLRDFLITTKEFSREDCDLYLEEIEAQQKRNVDEMKQYRASVKGLLKPDELDDDSVDNNYDQDV